MTQAYQSESPAQTEPEVIATAPQEGAATTPATAFTSSGAKPPVAPLKDGSAAPTPSQAAYSKDAPTAAGPGVDAVKALLAKGTPTPDQVVAVIDAHRSEHGAILSLLGAQLGPTYVSQVETATHHLRASIPNKEIVDGDPGDPNSGYFLASAAEQGARWRTADGSFTGTANKSGLDTTYKPDAADSIHAKIGADKSGTVRWDRNGKEEGELFGHYGSKSDYELGIDRPWELGSGALDTKLHHTVKDGHTTDALDASYKSKDGALTASGTAGITDGKFAGSATATDKLSATDTISGTASYSDKVAKLTGKEVHTWDGGSFTTAGTLQNGPTGTTGSLSGAYEDHGTKFDGSLTRGAGTTGLHLGGSGQVNPNLALDGTLDYNKPDHGAGETTAALNAKIGKQDQLHGKFGMGGNGETGSLSWDHAGKSEGEIDGAYKDAQNYSLGVKRPWELSNGGGLETDFSHKVAGGKTTDALSAAYHNKDSSFTANGALTDTNGVIGGNANFSDKIDAHNKITGAASYGPTGLDLSGSGEHTWDGGSFSGAGKFHTGPDGTTGSLSGAYQDKDKKFDGSLTRTKDSTALHFGGSDQINPNLNLSGAFDYTRPDHGQSQSTLTLSERYKSGKVIEGLDLEAGHGARDYLKATGSLDAQVGRNLYAGAWGSYTAETGKQTQGQIGGSLTLTSSEKTALTLAGALNQNGSVETRLQLDVFKSRIENVSDLADHKKDALVSLFVSYTQGGTRTMDDRFGAPQMDVGRPDNKVMAGIRIKF